MALSRSLPDEIRVNSFLCVPVCLFGGVYLVAKLLLASYII